MDKKNYTMLDIIKIPFKCSMGYAGSIAFQKLTEGFVPGIQILVTAGFLDTAVQIAEGKKELPDIMITLSLLIILIAYTWISAQVIKFMEAKLELALIEKFRADITEKRARLKYEYIEDQGTWDLISRVSKKPELIIKNAYINTLSFFSMLLKAMGILLILITQVWWAGIIILLISIPLIILALKGGKASYDADREATKYIRKYEYLEEVLTGREAALERTLFGFTDRINEKWREQFETARMILFRVFVKHFIRMKTGGVAAASVSILMSMVLIKPVLDDLLSAGMFISIVNGLFTLIQMMSTQLTYYVNELSKNREYLKDLSSFAQLDESDGALDIPSSRGVELDSLEFKNVSFKYPSTDDYILKNLSFRIDRGIHYAFVGANGAGKTTIIKLLTGLYKEFEGEILINGVNIRNYSLSELKSICSVVYQDFAKYFVSVRDNISLGNVSQINTEMQEERIKDAIRLMNMEEVINALPGKLDTPLGKIRSDGQDLSGGQWQRIALARSIVSPASLRVLDEPTASLDPISESDIYEEFEKISKGGTTILISHRLGSTKLAKVIYVLGNGTVIEKGSHEELMAAKGVYAEMYESQRSWYL